MAVSTTDNVITLKESSAENTVLKEYVNLKVDKINSEISHIREFMDEREKTNAKALILQFAENERRLDALNHEAARLSLMIPKEQFDIVVNQLRKEGEEARNKIVELEKDKSNRDGRMFVITFVWGIILLLISYFLNHKS